MDEQTFIAKLRREIAAAGTPYKWAKDNGISRSVISKVLANKMRVTPGLAQALGFRRVVEVTYEEIQECH